MVNFNENYHFSRFQRGSNIFQGGSNFFGGGGGGGGGGGVQLFIVFPIETHITCHFPGGRGVRTPCPPLWIRTCLKTEFLKKKSADDKKSMKNYQACKEL